MAALEVKRLEELVRNGGAALVQSLAIKKASLGLQDAESKKRGIAAKVAAGQARVKTLNEQLELSTLRAPIAGRLGMLLAAPGQSLAIGTAIAEVIDLTEIDVLCHVPPRVAAQLSLGLPARFKATDDAPAEAGAALGRIVYIAQQAHPETGNCAVKLRFPNPNLRLRAGAVVAVQVQTQPAKERYTVPDTALLEDTEPPGIVIFKDLAVVKTKDGKEEKQGKAKRLRAILGVRDPNWHVVEILGLQDPETKEQVPIKEALIIIEGGHGLHDGDLVKREEEEE